MPATRLLEGLLAKVQSAGGTSPEKMLSPTESTVQLQPEVCGIDRGRSGDARTAKARARSLAAKSQRLVAGNYPGRTHGGGLLFDEARVASHRGQETAGYPGARASGVTLASQPGRDTLTGREGVMNGLPVDSREPPTLVVAPATSSLVWGFRCSGH